VVVAGVENSASRALRATLEFALAGEAGNVRREVTLQPGHNRIQAEIPIPNPRLWTPQDPALYTLRSHLSAGEGRQDSLEQRFGMREFTIHDGNYYLNGKKILIKAAFWEGFYPQTLAFPPNPDVVRREIRLAKEAGINVLRLWRKPPAPLILDLADEMGMMIIDAPPIECMGFWPRLTPETEHRVAVEIRGMVERDRNHPSVIYWELFNEVLRPGLARLKRGMSLLARDTDPTRIVVDESGGWADGARAYAPYSYDAEPINELHSYLPAPVSPRTTNYYLTLGQPGFDVSMLGRSKIRAPDGIMFVSEVGYGGLPDLPANVAQYRRDGNPLTPDYRYHVALLEGIGKAIRELDWGGMFNDVAAVCRASQRIQAEGNKLQLEALRLNPRINGYCVHAYTDGDWVIGAGLLDLFRNPKLTYESIKQVQTPLYVAVRVNPSNLRQGQKGTLRIDAVNDLEPVRGKLEWKIAAPGGSVVLRETRDVPVGSGVSSLLETQLPALTVSGAHIAQVRFVPETGAPFANERQFFYLTKKDVAIPDVPFAVLDANRELSPMLQARGARFREFTGDEPELLPVLVAGDASPNPSSLLAYVARGGVAIFLKPPALPVVPTGAAPKPAADPRRFDWFPMHLQLRVARGNWVPVNHGVRPHPIFDGLPTRDFMGQVYLNICANETLEGVKAPPIVGSLSFTVDNGSPDRNYLGPGAVWWGADLVNVPHGKGQIVLSTLHLKENLETDPVAEKVLYNLIRWGSAVIAHERKGH
jgi:beta-galactosidase